MKSRLYEKLTTILLAALFAGCGAWVGAHYGASSRGHGSGLHDMVHAGLHLTADQEQRLETIEQKYASELKVKEADVRTANHELAAAMQESHQDSPQVEAAIDHIHMAMGALQKATIAHVFDMRSVLTPEQAKQFDAKVNAALTDPSR